MIFKYRIETNHDGHPLNERFCRDAADAAFWLAKLQRAMPNRKFKVVPR